jgi:hypothetical protein
LGTLAFGRSDDLGDTGVNPNTDSSAAPTYPDFEPTAIKSLGIVNRTLRRTLDGGETWQEVVLASPPTVLERVIWAGYDVDGNDLWIMATAYWNQIMNPGSKNTVYVSVDDGDAWEEFGQSLQDILDDNPESEQIVWMWTVL